MEAIILSELSQTKTYIQYHSYVASKKFKLVNITEKKTHRHRTGCPWGGGW